MVTWHRTERKLSKFHTRNGQSDADGQSREAEISADRLRQVTDGAPIGIFQTDKWDKYVYTNPRWSEITGVGPDQAAGSALDSVIASELRSDLMAHLDLPGKARRRALLSVRDTEVGRQATHRADDGCRHPGQ